MSYTEPPATPRGSYATFPITARPEPTFHVDPDTGGRKETKLARFDLIPAPALWLLAEHYGRGAQKYEEHNWRKGYRWSLSYAAAQRHLHEFWMGEDFDDETSALHTVAAAWHCLTLATFHTEHPDKDDRWIGGRL